MIEITHNPIDTQKVVALGARGINGAVVTFNGVIRGQSGGKRVRYLEYEAYAQMAQEKLEQVAQEVRERWQLEDISITHRVGRMEVGDVAVAIAVAAPHRQEAFEACHYTIDRIKEMVPIWKKEVFEDGESWVEPH